MVQLTDEELLALGKITYLWAVVDDLLATNSLFCSEFYKIPLGPGFKSTNFNKRREAWRLLVADLKHIPPAHRKRVLSIDGRIAKASDKRQELLHGVAYRGLSGGVQFLRQLPPKSIKHQSDLVALKAFADELSLIAGELTMMMELWGH